MTADPRWFDAADLLHDAPAGLVGVLEFAERHPAPALELHLVRRNGTTVALWCDEHGMPLAARPAGRA